MPARATSRLRRGPDALAIHMYNVGFGDCFLLQFRYGPEYRNVLVDFGSSAAPVGEAPGLMNRVARDIAARCGTGSTRPKLHAIVATHRHSDHISGFACGDGGSGDLIASLQPDVVVQPWTENPAAQPGAKDSVAVLSQGRFVSGSLSSRDQRSVAHGFLATLDQLQVLAGLIHKQANERRLPGDARVVAEIELSGLEDVLPGVRTHVLGPPTLAQTDAIRSRRAFDPEEFWHFAEWVHTWRLSADANRLIAGRDFRLFPRASCDRIESAPADVKWFAEQVRETRAEDLLGVVRTLDAALNNTSVILLFEVAGHYLLFPGDAQTESWSYALARPKDRELLSRVDLYKVGHHGSLNATPKSFWRLLEPRVRATRASRRITTLLSTMPGKHGHPEDGTEVPRQSLVDTLKAHTRLISTDTSEAGKICTSISFALSG